MRDFISKYAYPIIGVVFVIALLLVAFRGCGPSVPIVTKDQKAFYIDEETSEESERSAKEWPPLPGKSGRLTLVQARKFTTDGGQTNKISCLLKYPDAVREELISLPDNDARKQWLVTNELLIRRPGEGQKWVQVTSPEGQAIYNDPLLGNDSGELVWPK